MRLDALPVTFSLALLLCVDYALAAPSSSDHHHQQRDAPSSSGRSLHIPIVRRAPLQRNDTELGLWAKQQKQILEAKYGGQPLGSNSKRSTGFNMCVWNLPFLLRGISLTSLINTPTRLVNQNLDSRYVLSDHAHNDRIPF